MKGRVDPEGCQEPQVDGARVNDLFDGIEAGVACHKSSRGHLEGRSSFPFSVTKPKKVVLVAWNSHFSTLLNSLFSSNSSTSWTCSTHSLGVWENTKMPSMSQKDMNRYSNCPRGLLKDILHSLPYLLMKWSALQGSNFVKMAALCNGPKRRVQKWKRVLILDGNFI